ncbi:F0F1 ATP synthase subunit epsilon [Donghicola sp. XS_ASV15]|uniref:F0F1 ATP synthase subunit epsilon n=1 Tax=Donghicola sp. XS_ASV15 TaxID=3241295 RepID=UPI0035133B3E
MRGLALTIVTPLATLLDAEPVVAIRAEDRSGGFGILAGHTDFLTALPSSVLRWRLTSGQEYFCAVRAGLLRAEGGDKVTVACREGILSTDLEDLQRQVVQERQKEADRQRRERVEDTQMHTRTVRQLMRAFHPDRGSGLVHPPAIAFETEATDGA